jgi:hypothetical protein
MPNTPPSLTDFAPSVTFLENAVNAAPALIGGDVTFSDADDNLIGGTLTVSGLLAEDRVAIRNQGIGAGEIGVSDSDVTYGGVTVGSWIAILTGRISWKAVPPGPEQSSSRPPSMSARRD